MRFLAGFALLVVILWSGWWSLASFGLAGGINAWLNDRRAEGWQADVAEIGSGGYPFVLSKTLQNVALADPETGVAVELDNIVLSAAAYWPGDASVSLPETPMVFSAPDARSTLQMVDGEITLNLHPGTALELENLAWSSRDWLIGLPEEGAFFKGSSLDLAMRQLEQPEKYALRATVPNFEPGDTVRTRMRVPSDWPLVFDALALEAEIAFDRPWDRSAIEVQRPQPRQIKLNLAEASWAELRLNLAADLDVDDQGIPTGTMNIQARNWPLMLDLAERAGVLPVGLRAQAESGLQTLAQLNGNPDSLDVQLNFAGGMMAVGILPIGPAPRLVLR